MSSELSLNYSIRGDGIETLRRLTRDILGVGPAATRAFTQADRAIRQPRDEFGRFIKTTNDATRALQRFGASGDSIGRLRGLLAGIGTSFAGNLLASAVTGGFRASTDAARDFFSFAITSANDAAGAQLFLQSAVRETGGSYSKAKQEAEAFAAAVGVSTDKAESLFATATLGLQGTGIDSAKFLERAADLLVSRGRSLEELPTVVGQLFAGSDEGIGRLLGGGENPSTVWEAYATSVGKAAGSLSDLEKKQAVVNVVMERGAGQTGAAAARLQTFGGMLDQIKALATDSAARVGEALIRNEGVLRIFESVRSTLAGLATDEERLDQLMASVTDGFVRGALRAVDFAEAVATGGLEIYGFFQRAQVLAQQLTVEVLGGALKLASNIKLFAAEALSGILAIAGPAWEAFLRPLLELPALAAEQLRKLVNAVPESFRLIPGVEGSITSINLFADALSKGKDATALISEGFGAAEGALERFKQEQRDALETAAAYDLTSRDLSKQYVEIERGTDAATKRTREFFDGIREGLPAFQQFRARQEDLGKSHASVANALKQATEAQRKYQETIKKTSEEADKLAKKEVEAIAKAGEYETRLTSLRRAMSGLGDSQGPNDQIRGAFRAFEQATRADQLALASLGQFAAGVPAVVANLGATQRAADERLLSQLSSFSNQQILAAGYGNAYAEALARSADRTRPERLTAERATLDNTKKLTEAINGIAKLDTVGLQRKLDALGKTIAAKDLTGSITVAALPGTQIVDVAPAGGQTP
jgi:tRNA-dihydrouridine synthase